MLNETQLFTITVVWTFIFHMWFPNYRAAAT